MDDFLLQKRKELNAKIIAIRKELPHLYGFDLYPWQDDFLNSNKEYQFICAANQIGKSTILCIKNVRLATDQELWKRIWVKPPKLLAYFLPSQKTHEENVGTKWREVLPRGRFRHDDVYGWEWIKEGKIHRDSV